MQVFTPKRKLPFLAQKRFQTKIGRGREKSGMKDGKWRKDSK
jgi:hypothetical protein